MITEEELEQRTNGMLDRLSKDEIAELRKALRKLDKEQIAEAVERATVTKGGDRN